MTEPHIPSRVFPQAKEEADRAKTGVSTPQTANPAYRLAFQDLDFLLREDLRPVTPGPADDRAVAAEAPPCRQSDCERARYRSPKNATSLRRRMSSARPCQYFLSRASGSPNIEPEFFIPPAGAAVTASVATSLPTLVVLSAASS